MVPATPRYTMVCSGNLWMHSRHGGCLSPRQCSAKLGTCGSASMNSMRSFLSQSALRTNMHFICTLRGQKSSRGNTHPWISKRAGFQPPTIAVLYFQTTPKSVRLEREYKAKRRVRWWDIYFDTVWKQGKNYSTIYHKTLIYTYTIYQYHIYRDKYNILSNTSTILTVRTPPASSAKLAHEAFFTVSEHIHRMC